MDDVNDIERRALRDALDDEYRAMATYEHVIRDFAPERPFTNIVESERRHVAALVAVSRRHGLEAPENDWAGRVPRFAGVRDACEAAVEAELENTALYERLMRSTRRPDILGVFGALQRASCERHLPAFRRCAARGPGRGARRGRGR